MILKEVNLLTGNYKTAILSYQLEVRMRNKTIRVKSITKKAYEKARLLGFTVVFVQDAMNDSKGLETIGLIAAFWVLAAIVGHKLAPIRKRRKVERLCGYHMGSVARKASMALLDSLNCEMCKEEASHVQSRHL